MTTTKHTPGPWKIQYFGSGNPKTKEGFSRSISSEMFRICDLDADLSEANAALIAAAPELLAALKTAIATSDPIHKWVQEAKATIAKAEGNHA